MSLIIGRNIHLSFIVSGSSKGGVFEDWERPRFGRNWWFWLPKISNNGGGFKKGNCTDVGIMWLCFSADFTWFRN